MIRAALERYALASNREFGTDRTQTVGASEIGQCARKIYYIKNEADRVQGSARDGDHADRWGARTRGSVYEDAFWVPAMRAAFGERLLYAGAEQRTFVSDFLSATPDGLIVDLTEDECRSAGLPNGTACVDLDCKTADPRTKLDAAKPEHAYQVIVQLGLIRELTNHQPTNGILSYTDASFWDEVKTFVVPFDATVYAAAKARARDIMMAPDASALKPEGVIAGGRECDLCAFTTACGRRRADLVPDNETKVAMPDEIASLALQARELRDGADANMGEARAREHELREMMAAHGARKMAGLTSDGRKLSISWAALVGRPSIDNKALRIAAEQAGVDTSVFERAGEPSDRLVITIGSAS